jgi:hypothetical protein
MGRQLAAQLVVVEIGVEVGEDRAARLDPRDPRERILDTRIKTEIEKVDTVARNQRYRCA